MTDDLYFQNIAKKPEIVKSNKTGDKLHSLQFATISCRYLNTGKDEKKEQLTLAKESRMLDLVSL